MKKMIFKYKNVLYPSYIKTGNACSFIAQTAKQFCVGDGLDIGGISGWVLPGARPINILIDDEYDAFNLPNKKFAFYKVDGITFDEKTLLATPWHTAKAENIVSEYDVQTMFDSLMKRLDSAFKKSADGSVKIKNSPLYDYLQEAQDRYNAEQAFVQPEVKVA